MLFFMGTREKSLWMYFMDSRGSLRMGRCVSWASLYMAWNSSQGLGLKDFLGPLWGLDISKAKVTMLIVYMDNIMVIGDDFEEIQNLKGKLGKEFEIKDLGNLKYFLGIKVVRLKEGTHVPQRKYNLDLLLEETGTSGCKPSNTPINHNHKLRIKLDGVPVDKRDIKGLLASWYTYLIQGLTLHMLLVLWVNSYMLP